MGFSGKMSRLFLLPTMKVVLSRIIFVSLSHASAHLRFATTSSSLTGTRGACVPLPRRLARYRSRLRFRHPHSPTGAASPAMDAARDPTKEPT